MLASFVLQALSTKHLKPEHLQSTLISLSRELALVQSRVDMYARGLSTSIRPPGDKKDGPDLLHIEHCLKVIESCVSGRWEEEAKDVLSRSVGKIVEGLVVLGVYCEVIIARRDLRHAQPGELKVLWGLTPSTNVSCHLLQPRLASPAHSEFSSPCANLTRRVQPS